MGYKPTGKPPGRPRNDGLPAARLTQGDAAVAEETKLPVQDTPEFKAALDAVRAEVRAEFNVLLAGIKAAPAETDADWGERLALGIAELTDQGTNRKRVAPAEMVERRNAFERMGVLLSRDWKAAPRAEWPRYRLRAKILANDRVIDPFRRGADNETVPVSILHIGIPNLAMIPENDTAKAIMTEFVRYQGGSKEANSIAPAQPAWVTQKGTVIVGSEPSAAQRNVAHRVQGEGIYIDADADNESRDTFEITSPTDPRATKVPVLGTITEPAQVGQAFPKSV